MTSPTAIHTTNGRGRLFNSVIDTVGDTPAIRINNLGVAGPTLYVKAEFFDPASFVKDRLALDIIEDAERRGVLKPGQTVIEATSGNTGIGLAIVCAQKSYSLVVTMAESFSVERRKLMRVLGAITQAAGCVVRLVSSVEADMVSLRRCSYHGNGRAAAATR